MELVGYDLVSIVRAWPSPEPRAASDERHDSVNSILTKLEDGLRVALAALEGAQAEMAAAVAAERERCVGIAEQHAVAEEGNTAEEWAARAIAAKIREGL